MVIWNITPVTGHKWVRPVPKARYRYHVKGFKIKINTKHGTGTMLKGQMRKYSNMIHKMGTPQAFINTYVPKVPSEVRDNCMTPFLEEKTDFWSHRRNQKPGLSVCVRMVCGSIISNLSIHRFIGWSSTDPAAGSCQVPVWSVGAGSVLSCSPSLTDTIKQYCSTINKTGRTGN